MKQREWTGYNGRVWYVNHINNRSNINGNNDLDNNNGRLVGIAQPATEDTFMSPTLYEQVCSYDNLKQAEEKARKKKTLKPYVINYEKELEKNLLYLQYELQRQTYRPKPLETFIIRDPKTRKINKSDFRDRIVHHALCNVIEPLLDKQFIHDSYANRKGKGTHGAIKRFEIFKRKASSNFTKTCYVLKADIRHYFETVDHETLLSILQRELPDERILWLIHTILANYQATAAGRGMPLGNLTSQFFANVYLNELDQFVKHHLKAKYYLRYVDDFVILSDDKETLRQYEREINTFLTEKLSIALHSDKTKILTLEGGVSFLGLRIFEHHKLLRKKNMRKCERNLLNYKATYVRGETPREKVAISVQGWLAYATQADTYKYQRHIIRCFNQWFSETKFLEPREGPSRWFPKPPPAPLLLSKEISTPPPRTEEKEAPYSLRATSQGENFTLHHTKDVAALH